jgi:hypothetical protein
MVLFAETDYQIAVSNESQILKLLLVFSNLGCLTFKNCFH